MSEKVQVHLGSAVIGFAIIVVVVGAIYALSAARFQSVSSGYSDNPAAVLERIGPVGTVVLAGGETTAAAAPAAEVSPGEAIYNKACVACHASGVAGAPKLGDKAAWEPRLALGVDGLLQSAIKGKNAMPPRGTCMDCSDDDLKAAIEFMLGSVGAAPTEAPAESAPAAVEAPVAENEAASASASADEAADASAPAEVDVDLAAGEAIYNRACVVCHATGVAGAPKLGDQSAWRPRVAQGMEALLATAVNGRGAMPPRGTCMDCSDADLKAAIGFMVSKVQ